MRAGERWPVQLAAELRREGVLLAEPELIAESGWTTTNLGAALEERRPAGPFALVSLLIGANDQFQSRDLEAYRGTLRSLLARAAKLAGCDASRVVVLSIPDWSVTPFAGQRDRARIAAEVENFNRVCREETARAGARWVDITPASQRAGADRTLLSADGLHPSAAMYARWVELARPEVLRAVREGRAPSCP